MDDAQAILSPLLPNRRLVLWDVVGVGYHLVTRHTGSRGEAEWGVEPVDRERAYELVREHGPSIRFEAEPGVLQILLDAYDRLHPGKWESIDDDAVECPVVLTGEGAPITIRDRDGRTIGSPVRGLIKGTYLLIKALVDNWHAHGQGLTRKELQDASGLKSPQVVRSTIKGLQKRNPVWATVIAYEPPANRKGGAGNAGRHLLRWPS